MRSPSVFNFYDPDYVPNHTYFADNNLVSPELQIQTDQMLVGFFNRVYDQTNRYEKNKITVVDGRTLSEYASTRGYWNEHIIIDFTPQLQLIEQVIDGDTNGDFLNMENTDTDGIPFKLKGVDALIDHLDQLLLGSTMTSEYKQAFHDYLLDGAGTVHSNDFTEAREKIKSAVRYIVTSSAYMIQK